MQRSIRFGLIIVLITASTLMSYPLLVFSAPLDTSADRVIGQPTFATTTANQGGAASATTLNQPYDVTVDPASGRLYVADYSNSRVLSWLNAASLSNGEAADLVIGQPDLVSTGMNQGGSPAAKTLSRPTGVAVDERTGDLYIADFGNNRVLRYAAPHVTNQNADQVFGQAGSFTSNTSNTGGISANSLAGPVGLTVDGTGRLFISDSNNSRVLMYNLNGDTTADIVIGQQDFTIKAQNEGNATPNGGSLALPTDVAVDSDGNVYIADFGNNRVVEYSRPAGQFDVQAAATVFGQNLMTSNDSNKGGLSASSMSGPFSLALDAGNNLYIADRQNNRVLRYNVPLNSDQVADAVFGQAGSFTTGVMNNGGITADSLNSPTSVSLGSNGDLFVADRLSHRVLRFDVPLVVTPQVSSLSPAMVAINSSSFMLAVNGIGFLSTSVVQWNGVDRPTTFVSPYRLIASIPGADTAGLPSTYPITVVNPGSTSANFYVSLYYRFKQDTLADAVLGQPDFTSLTANNPVLSGLSANSLGAPYGVAVDPSSGRLYVADSLNNRVLSWPSATAFVNAQAADIVVGQTNMLGNTPNWGGSPDATSLNVPLAVAVDSSGNLYVADTFNNRVLEYDTPATGDVVADRVFGQLGSFTSTILNNGGLSTGLNLPLGMAFDSSGSLYITDASNHRVLVYNAPLTSDTNPDKVFGQPGLTTNAPNQQNAVPNASSLFLPFSVALDQRDNLYIADASNNRVLLYNQAPASDTIADKVFGQADFTGAVVNHGAAGPDATSLNSPSGVALDRNGNLYVADTENNRVLAYVAPLSSDTTADTVFGQPDMTSNVANNGGLGKNTFNNPIGLALDANRNLYVTDRNNNRALSFDTPLANPVPSLESLSPVAAIAGGPAFTLTVNGNGFTNDTIVRWNGATLNTTFVSNNQLTVQVTSAQIAVVGTAAVTVFTPTPGGGTSDSAAFTITNSPNPPLAGQKFIYLPLVQR